MSKELLNKNYLQKDPWDNLRSISKARIALGNSGGSLPTAAVLHFQEDHAFTKDAIYSDLKEKQLLEQLKEFQLPVY